MSKPPPPSKKSPSFLAAAFVHPANLVGLSVFGTAAAASGDPLPAIIGAGLESIYLAIVTSIPRFRKAVRARAGHSEVDEQVAAFLEDLAPSQREHYFFLRDLREKILANYRKLPGGRVLAASSEGRIDALLSSFLRLLSTLNSYRKYLGASDRRVLDEELASLRREIATDTNPKLREVKEKRIEILAQRTKRFEQAEESRELVSHQLAGIEDLLRLTHEQSIAIRDPESVSRQLEALTVEVQSTEETVREMERFIEFDEVVSSPMSHRTPVR